MSTSEKFCLKWNAFQENVITAFGSLRDDNIFTDVTLVCVDGKQMEAHKVILAASSPFFQNMLKVTKHAHPLIYMRGMKSEELLAIMDFMYYGEANIYQESLDTFLTIAEELKLKGLDGGGGKSGGSKQGEEGQQQADKTSALASAADVSHPYSEEQSVPEMTVAILNKEFPRDMKELDEQILTMMGRGDNAIKNGPHLTKAYTCQVCGKEGLRTQIKDHIEANHLEGIYIPCTKCDKVCRSRSAIKMHNIRNHASHN